MAEITFQIENYQETDLTALTMVFWAVEDNQYLEATSVEFSSDGSIRGYFDDRFPNYIAKCFGVGMGLVWSKEFVVVQEEDQLFTFKVK